MAKEPAKEYMRRVSWHAPGIRAILGFMHSELTLEQIRLLDASHQRFLDALDALEDAVEESTEDCAERFVALEDSRLALIDQFSIVEAGLSSLWEESIARLKADFVGVHHNCTQAKAVLCI